MRQALLWGHSSQHSHGPQVVCNVYPWSTTSADRNTLCFSLGKIPTLYRYTVYFLNSAHVHCVLDGKDFHFLTLNLGSWQGVTIHSLYCIFSVHGDCWRVDHMAESGEMNVSHRNFSGNSVCVGGGGVIEALLPRELPIRQ